MRSQGNTPGRNELIYDYSRLTVDGLSCMGTLAIFQHVMVVTDLLLLFSLHLECVVGFLQDPVYRMLLNSESELRKYTTMKQGTLILYSI